MLSHSKLILFLLIVILTVMITICNPFSKNKKKDNKKNDNTNQENFEDYITSIHAKRYNKNDIINPDKPVVNEACGDGFETTNLDILKNRMIYAKFCYQQKPHNDNVEPERYTSRFVNNFSVGERNHINQDPNEDLHNKVIRSHSDYLGCYKLYDGKGSDNEGKGKLNTLVNPKTATIGTGASNIQFDTLENIKKANGLSKVFMSGEIRSDLESRGLKTDANIPKSLGGPLSDTQFKKLTSYTDGKNLRIPDKYCLGRVHMENDRVKEYLGGVNAIAVYANNTVVPEVEKPPIYIRDNLIVNDRPCMDYVNMECIVNFKKHVVCDYNMVGTYWANASEFDSNKINMDSINIQENKDIKNFYNTLSVDGFIEMFLNDLVGGSFEPKTYVDQTSGIERSTFPGFSASVNTKMFLDPERQEFYRDIGKHNWVHFVEQQEESFWTVNPPPTWSDIVEHLSDLVVNRGVQKNTIKIIMDYLVLINKDTTYMPDRNIIIDRSGNENHMILDYNYLHFAGTFDIRANFGGDNRRGDINDYTSWLTDANNFKESKTDDIFNNLSDEYIIMSRYKNKNYINQAKYMIKKYNSDEDKLNEAQLIFCENHIDSLDGIKNDSAVMRGLSKEWPYLGMIGWFNDNTAYQKAGEGNAISEYNVISQVSVDSLPQCNRNATFNKARPPGNDKLIGRKKKRQGNLETSRTIHYMKDSSSGGYHDCTCTGRDGHYRCLHLQCLNQSFFKNVHEQENPNPLYVSVSMINTRNILKFYKSGSDTLYLKSKPELEKEDKKQFNKFYYKDGTKETINCNKFFMRTSNTINNSFKNEFMCVFSFNPQKKIDIDDGGNIYSIKYQTKKISHTNTSSSDDKYLGIIGNPMLSYSSNFRSKFDKNEIQIEGSQDGSDIRQYNQSFMWSYMRNYKKNKKGPMQDGLVYVKPKKVKSIVFLANKGRLSLGKITIYNLNGDIINNKEDSFKIFKYDTTFNSVNDSVLINYEQKSEENYKESSYLFTINPIKFMIQRRLGVKVENGNRIYYSNHELDGLENSYILSNYNFATNKNAFKLIKSERTPQGSGENKLQMDRDLLKKVNDYTNLPNVGYPGFFVSPYSERSSSKRSAGTTDSTDEKWIGDRTWFEVKQIENKSPQDIELIVKNVVSNHGFRYNPKLEIPATQNDFYMLKLNEADYISRIVIESGIQDMQTDVIQEDPYFFDTTINYYLEDNFEKVTMELYDESDTEKILEDTDEAQTQEIKKNIFNIKGTLTPIDTVNFRTDIIQHPYAQEWEANCKNSVIDFYNVDFIPDRIQDASLPNKNVGIICQKHSDAKKAAANIYQLYLKSTVNGNPKPSIKVEIPQDYLDSITSKNYNIKVGNLFFNHNELEMTRLTIFRQSFFEDLQDIIEAEEYEVNERAGIDAKYVKQLNNKKLQYLNKMIDKIILHKENDPNKNPYTLVHNEIKSSSSKESKETNIFKILNSVTASTTFEGVNGNFIKYKLDNAFGYMDLEGSNPNPNKHQEIYEGIFTRSLYDQ